MKKTLLILFGLLPILLIAQKKCVYFEKMVTLKVEKTDLNTMHSDFGPAFVGNELWFSSFTDEEIDKLAKGKKKNIYYNLFSYPADSKGNVKRDKTIQLVDESKDYHAGPVAYCEATGEMFVTLSNFENPDVRNKVYKKADIRLKVIIVKKQDGAWKKVGELPFNNPKYSVGHPTITSTGDTLYFTSDIPDKGGYGGTDIYMAVRGSNGEWGEMINMGEEINTEGNEMFPFIYKDKMLIFASNGREESKGLDLYHVALFPEGMTEISPIKELNSDADDFRFVIHKNEEVGYFTSNREGGIGDDDIYKVTLDKIVPKKEEPKYNLDLVVMDKKTNKVVENAKIVFDNVPSIISGLSFTKELNKNSSYTIKTDLEGYMNDSKIITTKDKPAGVIKDTLWVEKVIVGQKFVLDNIYYDFDKWDILPESEIELNKLIKVMKDNPTWKVELGSHTDSRGSDSYNKKLSQKRSDSAVSYITNNGILNSRIIAKGYGETELVNQCSNGVKCTKEQHRKNRRTEFKILEMDNK